MKKLTRPLYVAIALLLGASITSVAVAYQYPSIFGTVTVLEPITITPPTMSFSAYPNQRITINFTVTNSGPKSVTITINATAVSTPVGGSIADIRFITPSSYDALQGKNDAAITAVVGNGAVPGTYRIAIVFSRT